MCAFRVWQLTGGREKVAFYPFNRTGPTAPKWSLVDRIRSIWCLQVERADRRVCRGSWLRLKWQWWLLLRPHGGPHHGTFSSEGEEGGEGGWVEVVKSMIVHLIVLHCIPWSWWDVTNSNFITTTNKCFNQQQQRWDEIKEDDIRATRLINRNGSQWHITHLNFLLPFCLVTERSQHEAVLLKCWHEVLPLQHCSHLLISPCLGLDEHVRLDCNEEGGYDGASISNINVDFFSCVMEVTGKEKNETYFLYFDQ